MKRRAMDAVWYGILAVLAVGCATTETSVDGAGAPLVAKGENVAAAATPAQAAGDPQVAALVPPAEIQNAATAQQRLRDCTVMGTSTYQKPNVTITQPDVYFVLGPRVTMAQLRHVPSGGIRYYQTGPASVPPGTYVLSLHGSNWPPTHPYISACITYQ